MPWLGFDGSSKGIPFGSFYGLKFFFVSVKVSNKLLFVSLCYKSMACKKFMIFNMLFKIVGFAMTWELAPSLVRFLTFLAIC
jgi:hypothetical protein